jgi:1-aminocyclopropane-1-carboxylate deaminase
MLALQQLETSSWPTSVVSYGGSQSNAMLALAAVVHYQNTRLSLNDDDPKKKRFVYYTKRLPRFLKNQPSGNLFRAISLGMELVELSPDDYNSLFGSERGGSGDEAPIQLDPPTPGDSLWIPQGGACGMAVTGTRLLAQEILQFWAKNGTKQPLSVCIPGGTCSTAVLVHKALKDLQSAVPDDGKLDVEVVVVPCVGDKAYARRQMMYLNSQVFGSSSKLDDIPVVLAPTPKYGQRTNEKGSNYFRFGVPDALILNTFRELRDTHELVLDLLYGAPAWTILFRHWASSSLLGAVPKFDPESPFDGRRIMYVHSGGLEGINSQMLRYKHNNLVDMDEIQLPGRSNKP